jgi:hypothetical protein
VENKKERITGLIVGLIGFVLLFFLSWDLLDFEDGIYYSFIGQISVEIGQMTINCRTCDNFVPWAWSGFAIIYFLLVWKYRACVGHWVIKTIRMFYKKI